MIAVTKCQHCGNNFEVDGMERTEFCPHCFKETTVIAQVPISAPVSTAQVPIPTSVRIPGTFSSLKERLRSALNPRPAPASLSGAVDTATTLKQIRQQTCYKTLRELIDLVQLLLFFAAGLALLGGIAGLLMAIANLFGLFKGIEISAATNFVNFIVCVAAAFILIVLAIAWKQAALLLVDIADCQIRLVANKA